MKFLWTNFRALLRRFRVASLLNVAGLAAALAVAIVVAIQVRWDFTYDRGWAGSERVFTIRRYMHADGLELWASPWSWPIEVKADIPEVEGYTLLDQGGNAVVEFAGADGAAVQHTVRHTQVRGSFLEMFAPRIIAGDTTGLFRDPGLAMISRKNAERIFGSGAKGAKGAAGVSGAVGRTLTVHRSDTPLTIAAVYDDFPDNRSIPNGLFSYIAEDVAGGSFAYYVYYLIDPADAPAVVEKLNSPPFIDEDTLAYFDENPDARMSLRLPALADLYLYQERSGGMRQVDTTLSLLAIGVLVLVIAWINFINLAMAMAPSRVRSINIHRILGISKRTLRVSMAFEGIGLTLIALAVALLAIYGFASSPMAGLFNSPLTPEANIPIIAVVAAVALAVAFLIGLYAAKYSTSFDVAIALKGSFALSKRGTRLRNSLIVIQFAAAMALISVAAMIRAQHDYMVSRPWGFDKDNIVRLDATGTDRENWDSFGGELLKNPNVKDWTASVNRPGYGMYSWNTRQFEGRTINTTNFWTVWPNFLRFFEVAVTAGSDFEDGAGGGQLIFNEEFLRVYDFEPQELIGKDFYGEVVGVAENVHFESMHEPLKPMAFVTMETSGNMGFFLVKISGDDVPGTLAHIEKVWKKFTDIEFGYHFLDAELDALYRREANMARLIGLFSLVTVIIAMMGVYGLIFFNARYRTREIAIRKVNGAGVGEVVRMLNRGMMLQLTIAFVVATPLAIFIVRRWLEQFAFRAEMRWWIFAAAGVVVAAVSIATVSLQSLRAARANPVKALKNE